VQGGKVIKKKIEKFSLLGCGSYLLQGVILEGWSVGRVDSVQAPPSAQGKVVTSSSQREKENFENKADRRFQKTWIKALSHKGMSERGDSKKKSEGDQSCARAYEVKKRKSKQSPSPSENRQIEREGKGNEKEIIIVRGTHANNPPTGG